MPRARAKTAEAQSAAPTRDRKAAEPGRRKIFVLDTNVLLHDPFALFKFEENEVILPLVVIEELDTFKRGEQELARNARTVLRLLDRERTKGSLLKGVTLDGGGLLRVEMATEAARLPDGSIGTTKVDNIILQAARDLVRPEGGEVTLVTKDTNLRIKADAVGLRAEDYLHDRIKSDELYSGQVEMVVPAEVIEQAARDETLGEPWTHDLRVNEFVLLRNAAKSQHTVLARYKGGEKLGILRRSEAIWGIRPRNKEQQCAFDLLLDDSIMLVTLVGKAGTGKTLLALAAGLQRSVDDGTYKRLLVSRPVLPMGRDLGYLPGDVDEKLRPWMQPIFDNLELIVSGRERPDRNERNGSGRKAGPNLYEDLMDQKFIAVEPLTYIRGRSIPHQYLIIDESQNLTPHEIKTIITRAGDGTKIVLTGDPQQIDHPYVDAYTNGLSYVVEHFKGQALYGHVSLTRGERSALAELASNLL